MAPSRALIIGITGQDGSYLAEFLLARDYQVHGVIRRASSFNTARLDHLYRDHHDLDPTAPGLILHHGDLTDGSGLRRLLNTVKPHEIYNLGAQSHVRVSFDQAEYTADVVAQGTLRLLEAVRDYQQATGDQARLYQDGSSEMFGAAPAPQSEATAFYPRSPYAVAKVAAHWYAVNYRESYDLFAANGILFNHESPRRGETFVTRKISRAVGRIVHGLLDKLYLGNLEAVRDWGFAGDYVEAMWRMLRHGRADDFVIATGSGHSVRQFLELAFGRVGRDYRDFVAFDPRFLRPTEVNRLEGDARRAADALGWRPKVSFAELVAMMVDSDLDLAARELSLRDNGHAAVHVG